MYPFSIEVKIALIGPICLHQKSTACFTSAGNDDVDAVCADVGIVVTEAVCPTAASCKEKIATAVSLREFIVLRHSVHPHFQVHRGSFI